MFFIIIYKKITNTPVAIQKFSFLSIFYIFVIKLLYPKHMKHFYLIIMLLFGTIANGQVSTYLQQFKDTNRSNPKLEQKILNESSDFLNQVIPFTTDSLKQVRLKAYYLIFKKGLNSTPENQSAYINKLLNGCNDAETSIIGQNLIWLQAFPKQVFNLEAQTKINQLLQNNRLPHRNKAILLAGYVNTGQDILKQAILQPDITEKEKWIVHLALARTGYEKSISFCIEKVENIDLNNQTVELILPNLIYTRQPELLNICIRHLYNNDKNCFLSDPDNERQIVCGYRIMELLAPVIEGFPYKTDATGTLVTENYTKALTVVREWFNQNQNYQIKNNFF